MATVLDVAEKIVEMRPLVRSDWTKLQKLVYYAQAWSLAWDGRPLFADPLQAWKNGPASPRLYAKQCHEQNVFGGNPSALDSKAHATIEAVVEAFGDRPASWLSELAHRERPWLSARSGLPAEARGETVITHDSMRAWYGQFPIQPRSFSPAFMRGLDVLVETPPDEIALLYGDPADGASYVAWLKEGDQARPDDF